jgi:predicted ArsR family transcriptional regulator
VRPTVELTDPRALRAYAHPTRMALIGLLRRHGPRTATQAAAEIGESVASCSFHLRQLARFGLIEQVEGDHGRQKPWRATALSTSWSSDSADPELAAAATLLDTVLLDRYHEQARAWLAHRDQESLAWRRAAIGGDWLLHLTPTELRRLGERIEALFAEYGPRNADPARRPRGTRPVSVITLGYPEPDLEPDPDVESESEPSAVDQTATEQPS